MSGDVLPIIDERDGLCVDLARTLEDLLQVISVRALVYLGEDHCPYGEEFDGNDFLGAAHLIVRAGPEPVGVMRMRWFADFVKVERVAVRADRRGGRAAQLLIKAAIALSETKGYRRIIGHIKAPLLPFWKRAGGVIARPGRPRFRFSDFDYVEVERELNPPPDAIGLETSALVLLRPEGRWGTPGILDQSSERPANLSAVA
jgi:predicted GNAT family N-acyltransferase